MHEFKILVRHRPEPTEKRENKNDVKLFSNLCVF